MIRRLLTMTVLATIAGSAAAQQTLIADVPTDTPVMLTSDQMDYDQQAAVVTAKGNVEVVQGPRTLLADAITYDQKTGVVKAQGNVTVLDPAGNTFFANDVVLKDDMKQGVVQQFRARLSDNSRFAAAQGTRVSETVTELDRAVYSPCLPCRNDPRHAPLWQIKAEHVKIDQEEERISYRNAMMEFYGVPILYTPYFSHPTPDAKRKSGILIPKYSVSDQLGVRIDLPYYWNIAPQMDATLLPIYTSKEGPVMAGEFRHLTESGMYTIRGSITDPRKRDDQGNRLEDHDLRGHVDADGRFRVSEDWNWGFNVKRASDDTYLRRYDFSNEDLLTSRAYLEGAPNTRSFASLETLAFQDLREIENDDSSPVALPLATMNYSTMPGWHGSTFQFDADALALIRDTGVQSRRVTLDSGWVVPVTTEGGHRFEFRTGVRTDAYSIDELGSTTSDTEGEAIRAIPEASALWRYPLARVAGDTTITVEPIVRAIVSSYGQDLEDIPNEDSQAPSLSDANLFDRQRFVGRDRVETGPRVAYGVQGGAINPAGRLEWLVGQSAAMKPDEAMKNLLGYGDHFSDVVSRVGVSSGRVDAIWRARFSEDNLAFREHDITASVNLHPLAVSATYTVLNADPILGDRREVGAAASLAMSPNWTFSTGARRDVSDGGGMINANAGLEFHNECLTVLTMLNREFTRDRDIEPSTSISVQILPKNLSRF